MLGKVPTLKNPQEFKRVFSLSKKFYTDHFKMLVHKRNSQASDETSKKVVKPEPRFGFIVSTKISKKAVARNTSRRKVSEIIRRHQKEVFEKMKDKDIVIYINADLRELAKQDKDFNDSLEKEILGLMEEAANL